MANILTQHVDERQLTYAIRSECEHDGRNVIFSTLLPFLLCLAVSTLSWHVAVLMFSVCVCCSTVLHG